MRNTGCEHIIERRDAIRRDEQQAIAAEFIDIAHFAAGKQL